jgi:hypothetical protein
MNQAQITQFLLGGGVMGCLVGGLFFLRFWRRTKDRLFMIFALAFCILWLNWALLALTSPEDEARRALVYVLLLVAFILIIYAIADHRNRAVGFFQLANDVDFVVRQQLGIRVVDADLARQRLRTRLIVSGQHHDALHTVASQHLYGCAGGFARPIGERDDAERTSLAGDENRGASSGSKRVEGGMNGRIAKPALFDQPVVSDERRLTSDDCLRPAAGD